MHFALSKSESAGILILPCWSSTTFWPLSFQNQNISVEIIQDVLYLMSVSLGQRNYEGSFIGSNILTNRLCCCF